MLSLAKLFLMFERTNDCVCIVVSCNEGRSKVADHLLRLIALVVAAPYADG